MKSHLNQIWIRFKLDLRAVNVNTLPPRQILIHTIRIISPTVLRRVMKLDTMNDHWSPNFLVETFQHYIEIYIFLLNLIPIRNKFINMKLMKPKIFFLVAFPRVSLGLMLGGWRVWEEEVVTSQLHRRSLRKLRTRDRGLLGDSWAECGVSVTWTLPRRGRRVIR